MTLDLAKLRALAEAATPGEWRLNDRCNNADPDEACGVETVYINSFGHRESIFKSDAYDECSHPVSMADASFIAAANPQAVLELIDEVERLRATSLTPEEASLCDWGLGVLTSDYNEAPHDNIGALRERLKRERV